MQEEPEKQLALVEIEGRLEQQTGLELPQVSRIQGVNIRLVSRVFHRPQK